MEVERKLVNEIVGVVKRREWEQDTFQIRCRALAGYLFKILRKTDPWCIEINFEGPLPLGPLTPSVLGYMTAFIHDYCDAEDPRSPFIDYYRFEITVPDEEGCPLQKVILHKGLMPYMDLNVLGWELRTEVKVSGKDFADSKYPRDQDTFKKIYSGSWEWRCSPPKR